MRLGPVEITPHDAVDAGRRALETVLAELDVIEVTPEYIVGTRKLDHPLTTAGAQPTMRELGGSGSTWRRAVGGDEYNPELRGVLGLDTYERMRRGDGSVAEALKVAKTPVLQAEWWVDSADPESSDANMQAEFVSKALFEWQSIGWTQFLTECLTMLDFGYSFFEKVFTFHTWRQRRRLIWRKFAPRAVRDVQTWEYDEHGGPRSVEMTSFEGTTGIIIPIQKLLVFTYRREAGNVEGRSALREIYKHWYYLENLYKIDAIQKERHGIGIPVITLPPNFNETDRKLADELGRNLRTNEWAHITLPPGWMVEFAEVKGQTVDVMKSAAFHDAKILDSVIGGFTRTDEKSDAEVMVDIFMKSSRHLADLIREVINKHAIPELVSHNWTGINDFPQLRVRHIGQVADLRTISFTLRNLIGAKAIIPDEELEEYLREINDLPRRDPTTAREVSTPQFPDDDEEDMPRQSTASRQQLLPGESAGEDGSGG